MRESKWMLVPQMPDDGMLEAGANWTDYEPEDKEGLALNADMHCAKRVFQAMCAAAPTAPDVVGVLEDALRIIEVRKGDPNALGCDVWEDSDGYPRSRPCTDVLCETFRALLSQLSDAIGKESQKK